MGIIAAILLVGAFASGAALWFWGPFVTGQHENVVQPVQFTHSHHVAGLGLDCRFCHIQVEQSATAGIPPTQVCMTCHSQLWTDAPILEPVRESWKTEKPIPWVRVHNLAKFVYFNHSIHITKGIGCNECHGRVDQMPILFQEAPLQMRWCLECHTAPEKHVRPKDEVFNIAYEHPKEEEQEKLGKQLLADYQIHSKISCSTCHR